MSRSRSYSTPSSPPANASVVDGGVIERIGAGRERERSILFSGVE